VLPSRCANKSISLRELYLKSSFIYLSIHGAMAGAVLEIHKYIYFIHGTTAEMVTSLYSRSHDILKRYSNISISLTELQLVLSFT